MTREEAIFCENSYIGKTSCVDCKYYGTDTCKSRESHKMAIKALIAIDNIKAEIENLPSELMRDGRRMVRRGSVFRIIDKHIREVMNE